MSFAPPTPGVAVASAFQRDGFVILPPLLAEDECEQLAVELSKLLGVQQKASRNKLGGLRNLLRICPPVGALAASPKITDWLECLLGRTVFPVRALFFDKTAASNWWVPWHQDLTIAVAQKVECQGFEGWSLKTGIPHVQPPAVILEGMLALRFHLDDCTAANGALRVIPCSHLGGKLLPAAIARMVATSPEVVCEIPRGGAMAMRPLLLHASSPARHPAHRRVLHIEYATTELGGGLKWFDA